MNDFYFSFSKTKKCLFFIRFLSFSSSFSFSSFSSNSNGKFFSKKNLFISIFYFLHFFPIIFGFNVDIEKPLIFNGTQSGSHFGFSLAIWTKKNSNSQEEIKLMVAAPKFGYFDDHPGKLYECPISRRKESLSTEKYIQCTSQVAFSDDSSLGAQAYNQQQWLGVAMDVNEASGKLIVCAHRWCEIVSKQLRMVGACYLLSPSHKEIWAPLLGLPKKNGVFYQGMAQFGTSAQFSKNNKDILFGAPGIYQGRGGFVIKDMLSDNFTTVDYSNTEHHKVHSREEYQDSMVGYSITSGNFFFNQIQIAVGGPGPSTFGLGKVLIYSGDILIGRYSGSQYGGGFGSSLTSGNFSGNKNDDLVVGAPMEYDVVNEGRVYILGNSRWGSFSENKIVLVGDNIPGAHFGTSVANIGDLNKDGLDDLAVGAPFEDDTGSVYIYYGSLISIDEKRRQKVKGRTLSPGLKGFGISFSRPKDVDNDGYLDFAVGAFLSDQAVLLHTRPVIKFSKIIQSSPPELNPQDRNCFGDIFKSGCLELSVRIKLLGKAYEKVDLDVEISVDVEKKETERRSALKNPNEKQIQTKLGIKNEFHKIYQLKTKKTKDLFKPIVVQLKVVVKSNLTNTNILPVQDLLEPNVIKYEIPFLNDCGVDKLCAVDLQTGLNYIGLEKNNVLLIGGERQFRIGVTIANGHEPAYQPLGTLVYPDYINYVRYSQPGGHLILGCQLEMTANTSESDGGNEVICSFNNPLQKGRFYYELIFDIPQANQVVRQFEMKFSIISEGFEMYPKSNEAILEIKMRKKSLLNVNTISDPQFVLVNLKKDKTPSNKIKFVTHQYGFYNNGPSDLKRGNFTFKIYKIKSILQQIDIQWNQTERFPQIKRLYRNENPKFSEIKFNFENWKKETLFSFEIYLKIDVSKLNSNLPTLKSELILESVKDEEYVDNIAVEEKLYTVETNLRFPGQTKPVDTWIIIVCIIIGILLLMGFIAGLWKCGFFKREKVHHVRQHEGSMKQEVQPDPDSEPLT